MGGSRPVEAERHQVVVVDDSADVRELVSLRLASSDSFEVVGKGATGMEAIELARTRRPGLMLLDLSMPDMGGMEALPEIRRISPDTRVVIFTGFDAGDLAEEAHRHGAAGFLQKSVPIAALPDRLLELLHQPMPSATAATSGDQPSLVPVIAGGDDKDQAVMQAHLERFHSLFEEAAIGMATLTLGGRFVRLNRAFAELLGAQEQVLVDIPFSRLVPGDSAAVIDSGIAELASGGRTLLQLEHDLPSARGDRPVHVLSSLATVRDSSGLPLYLFLQLQDVTKRRDAAEQQERTTRELTVANQRLRQAAQEKGDLLAVTAHEMRTPLAVIKGYAETLRQDWELLATGKREVALGAIFSNAERLQVLVDDLLTASRLEAGGLRVDLEPVPLRPVVDETVAAIQALDPGEIEVVCDPDLVMLADSDRLTQILTNYLDNAVKHGVPPIRLRASREGGDVVVRVANAGPPVAAELEPRLFEKFSRGATVSAGGAGLGLYIVRGLARAQGGEAWYEASPSGPVFALRQGAAPPREAGESA